MGYAGAHGDSRPGRTLVAEGGVWGAYGQRAADVRAGVAGEQASELYRQRRSRLDGFRRVEAGSPVGHAAGGCRRRCLF